MTIGLIGYGRFGKLAARFFARRSKVVVYDRRKVSIVPGSERIRIAPLSVVASQEVVVLAVPISVLQGSLREILPYLRPGALVVDVCSVKMGPVRWMKAILPTSVYQLGTHPLFGPDSVSRSLRKRSVVLCPVRVPRRLLGKVVAALQDEGLDVQTMTPWEHDKMMAETLLLTQYIGRLLHCAGVRSWPRSTLHYKKLLDIVKVAERDSLDLFRDMWNFNPHARRLLKMLEKGERRLALELR